MTTSEVTSEVTSETTIGPARAPRLEPRRGDIIGRFLVIDVLGKGGGGTVLAAYDPSLDRKIALKLVALDPADVARVLAEAQALARVSHPNVVTVHEVGTTMDHVFIAMELIDGITLEAWLASPSRTTSEILSTFLAAARGLAATHRAGLIHRDFKPRNVMVDADGRVCLLDFGLARSLEMGAAPEISGTPRYMAPEQARGDAPDARSDQFSFCVALEDALGSRACPRRIVRALQRGRDPDPARRFESMEALIAELGGRRRSRTRALAAVVFAAIAALGASRLLAPSTQRGPSCPDAAALISSTWNDARRAQLERVLGADSRRALAAIDDYVASWATMRHQACHAARIAGTESDHMHELRVHCLDGRRDALAAALDVLEGGADAGGAVLAIKGLPQLASCDDRSWLLARVKPPADARTAERVADVRELVERARTQFWLGRYGEALSTARDARSIAMALDYPPIQAEAILQVGLYLGYTGKNQEALELLRQAARIALRAGDYETTIRAWSVMTYVVGIALGDRATAYEIASDAEAMVGGLPADGSLLRASILGRRAVLLTADHRYDEALRDLRSVLEIREQQLGAEHPDTAFVYVPLAAALYDRGDYAEALEVARRGRDLFRTRISELHPEMLRATKLVALAERKLGRPEVAVRELVAALPLIPDALGTDPYALGAALHLDLGRALRELARIGEALVYLRIARDDLAARGSSDLAIAESELAHTLVLAGQHAEGTALQRQAVTRGEQTLGGRAAYSIVLAHAGFLERHQGNAGRALELYERALAVRAKRGHAHPELCELISPIDELRDQLRLSALEHPAREHCR